MKTRPMNAIWESRVIAWASVICAWMPLGSSLAFGVDVGSASAAVLDFDGDGRADLAVRRGAVIHVRSDVAQEGSSWRTIPVSAEIDRPDVKMHGADLDGDRREEMIFTYPGANRVWILAGSAASEDARVRELALVGGPTAVAVSTPSGQAYASAWCLAFETPVPYLASTRAGRAGVEFERWEWESDGSEWVETLDLAAIPAVGAEPARWVRLLRAPARPGNDSELDLSWHVSNSTTRRFHRVKYGDITLKRGYISLEAVGFPLATETSAVVVWGPGGNDLITLFPPPREGGAVRALTVETGGHESIRWVPGKPAPTGSVGAEGGRLLVVGVQGRKVLVYRATAQSDWKLEASVDAPAGGSFQDALPLIDGGLLALSGLGRGMDSEAAAQFTVYRNQNGKLELAFTGDLPVSTRDRAQTFARVRLFDRDPFRDPGALELESLAAEDWVSSARWLGDSVEIASAKFQSSRQGLGLATVKLVRPTQAMPSGAFALGNQWEPASSLHFGSRPAAPGTATVLPAPTPGSYARGVEVIFSAPDKTTVYARVGSGPWQTGRGPYAIRQSGVLEFYGVDVTGRAGPRVRAPYRIGDATSTPAANLVTDADADGLNDAWERQVFGDLSVGAGEDTDGDGATAREEYVSLTDPRNPRSRPPGTTDPGPVPAPKVVLMLGASVSLGFQGVGGVTYWVEVSEDLKAWKRSTEAIQIRDGQHQWVDREAPASTRYYRVGGQR